MHFAISTSWGPSDPTKVSLPFRFASSALGAGDTVIIMLFDDAVLVAVEGAYEKLFTIGPSEGFSEVFSHRNAEVVVSKCCADARGIREDMLMTHCRFGRINDFHAHVALDDTKAVSF